MRFTNTGEVAAPRSFRAARRRPVSRSGSGSASMTGMSKVWLLSRSMRDSSRTRCPMPAISTAASCARGRLRCWARAFSRSRDQSNNLSGMRSSSSAWPVGAISMMTMEARFFPEASSRSRMRKIARISSTPGGTMSSSEEKSRRSKLRSTWIPLCSPLSALSTMPFMRSLHRWNSATESNSAARSPRSPCTGATSSPIFCRKTSSRDGAGSVEQIVTSFCGLACRWTNAKAAEMVVLPTPPLPRVSARGTSRSGQAARRRRCSMPWSRGVRLGGENFFPANTCAP